MRRFPSYVSLVLVLLGSVWANAQKKGPRFSNRPGQVIDLEAPKLVTAKQNCENWALAAGLEGMLRQQDVALDQSFWVMRMNGGELCMPDLPSIDTLSDRVNREFVLDGNRHVVLELHYVPGAPNNPDLLIAGLQQQQLSLLQLRGHLYYLTGATYDEHVRNDGGRIFVITELRLANTFPHEPSVAFVNGKDNMDEIGGTISVSATPVPLRW
jgi:hypothetical protein